LHKQNKHELGEKDGESESIGKKDYNAEEIGLATYSNSKSTVLSYRAIFDSLWRKTELYQKLEMANQQLKENEILHKDFIHIAAHELKNPLQPILSLSSFLKHILNKKGSKDVLIDKKQANEIVDLIIKNTNKMIRLTNDILDMTRIETKTFSLCKEKVDLMILLSDILSDYNTLNVDSSNIKTSYYHNNSNSSTKIISNTINTIFKEQNYNNNAYLVEIDKSRISQVITNLLDNAYKFTDKGDKIYVDINLKNKDNKKFVVVTIKDTGKGIDFDIAPKLFAKFATKSNKGTGLGLFICKNIIEAHGGSIWGYNNDDGKGATFGFSLPLLPLN
jgi:signal transduction histidine kinase